MNPSFHIEKRKQEAGKAEECSAGEWDSEKCNLFPCRSFPCLTFLSPLRFLCLLLLKVCRDENPTRKHFTGANRGNGGELPHVKFNLNNASSAGSRKGRGMFGKGMGIGKMQFIPLPFIPLPPFPASLSVFSACSC